ncbi:glutathione S-transferase family protein [Shewanella dokdonensis]|uniref:Glutathione S-transferase family protein n=1 Tax=Shewanella dokdonensis TaxID=712036 RepID=A0ABX8DIQ1_9GAMM|nr:glutathione S-transferase family protein [Shewanella dokdonensis]MCL1075892.1 glutathione S-transferase family protein [Shewanella dokdonensis]QVK24215.1 glutathione S-transferase family protein [Shewanella dokdonensis]
MAAFRVYGDAQSGNCYKVQLLCALLHLDYEWVAVDILAGDTRVSSFLEKNPNGKIPLLELSDGRTLSESNAIINYLAHGSALLPSEPFALAKVQQWQFFEQYSHEPYIAVARFIAKYLGLPAERRAEYEAKQKGGHKALAVMEQQLQHSQFIAGDSLSTADISLFAYTHVADEGGFSLEHYPAIDAWIDRIKALAAFRPMGA